MQQQPLTAMAPLGLGCSEALPRAPTGAYHTPREPSGSSPEGGYHRLGQPRTLVSKSCGVYPRKQSHSSS